MIHYSLCRKFNRESKGRERQTQKAQPLTLLPNSKDTGRWLVGDTRWRQYYVTGRPRANGTRCQIFHNV